MKQSVSAPSSFGPIDNITQARRQPSSMRQLAYYYVLCSLPIFGANAQSLSPVPSLAEDVLGSAGIISCPSGEVVMCRGEGGVQFNCGCEPPTPTPTPVPTPTPTPIPRPTPTPPPPTPTPTPQPTPTPVPTPTPKLDCPYGKFSLERLRKGNGVAADSLKYNGNALGNSCVNAWVEQIFERASDATYYEDDSYAKAAAELFFPGQFGSGQSKQSYREFSEPRELENGAVCYGTVSHSYFTSSRTNHCGAGEFYFDAACNIVPKSLVDQVCGEVELGFEVNYIHSSPISLLWRPGVDIDASVSIVDFPLHPGKPGQRYGWRASGDAPLLVYDPDGSGRVDSSFQLFGNWTFGGKSIAARESSVRNDAAAPIGTPWNNGYEALAELDRNRDGEISGVELEVLSLWFDHNQDGVVQAGEVMRVAEAGVSALFYKPDAVQSHAHHVRATIGFSRSVNGTNEIGASVDWYAESAADDFSLSNALFQTKLLSQRTIAVPEVHGASQGGAESALGGIWQWGERDGGGAASGLLVLDVTSGASAAGGGQVRGYSVVTSEFRGGNQASQVAGLVQMYPIVGRIVQDAAGNPGFTFTRTEGETTLTTTSYLNPQTGQLRGLTKAVVKRASGTQEILYRWSGERRVR